jgi:anaerobic magnesium-protoporphyrin IX monomethyl ester cyclase
VKFAFVVAEELNFGVGYISSFLKSQGHNVRLFFDPRQFSRPYARVTQNAFLAKFFNVEDDIIQEIKEYNPDITGFSCMYATWEWALLMAQKVRQILPSGARIIFGGVHPTICPEDFPKEFEVCKGDGVKYFGGEFDPDKIWMDREIFLEHLAPIHRRVQMFMTGFGCPFKCSYCNSPQLHRKIIRRDPENCIRELEYMKTLGLKYLLVNDDIFTIQKNWLKKYLPMYRDRIGVPYTCFGHAKYLDDEIMELLKMSGCQMVWLGIQTGDEKIRKEVLNRHETNKEIKNAVGLIKKYGLRLMIDHIFGIPKDTDMEYSYYFYKSLKPDVINCYELLYFPKTEICKYGASSAKYQKEGGKNYKRYAQSFCSLALIRD